MSFINYYRSPDDIINEEIKNEKTRIPQVNSNALLRHKLSYWKKQQSEQLRRKKVSIKLNKSIEKTRKREERKIKSKHCVSKYKVECSNCGQGFRTKKELTAHTNHYKKQKQKWGNTCHFMNSTNYKLNSVSIKDEKKNDDLIESSFNVIISDIETIVTMIKERMKHVNVKCDKCRNTFSECALKSMTCKYGHKLCAGCHEDNSKCNFCTMHYKTSHVSNYNLEQASKIRAESTRFKRQTQTQPVPKIISSRPEEEHPRYCNICYEVCKVPLFKLDCGGKHSMCFECTSEVVRQSYGRASCPFCRRKFTPP